MLNKLLWKAAVELVEQNRQKEGLSAALTGKQADIVDPGMQGMSPDGAAGGGGDNQEALAVLAPFIQQAVRTELQNANGGGGNAGGGGGAAGGGGKGTGMKKPNPMEDKLDKLMQMVTAQAILLGRIAESADLPFSGPDVIGAAGIQAEPSPEEAAMAEAGVKQAQAFTGFAKLIHDAGISR